MDVWFCILQEPPPRGNNRELKDLEKLFHALLLSAPGELLPLDKDLSWRSATRKLRFVESWHPYGALALMTPHAIRAPELPAGSVL
jgi:hypothetical protein